MDLGNFGSGNFISNDNLANIVPNIPLNPNLLPNSNLDNLNQINPICLAEQFINPVNLNSQPLNQNFVDSEPIVITQDVFVPQPVVVKQVYVPKPYLPYSRWHKNGFPCFW